MAGQFDKAEPDVIQLDNWPIQPSATNPVVSLRSGRSLALLVNNTDTTNNSRANFYLSYSGDPELGLLSPTALNLFRVTAGAPHTDPLLFSTYTTLSALATAINAVGSGWAATVQTGNVNFPNWPTTDVFASQGAAAGALSTGQTQGLWVYATDLPVASVDVESGTIYLPQGATTFGQGPGNVWQWPGSSDFAMGGSSWREPVLCSYAAGWPSASIPEDIQAATYQTIERILYEWQTVHRFDSETGDAFTAKLAGAEQIAIPQSALRLLAPYRRRD